MMLQLILVSFVIFASSLPQSEIYAICNLNNLYNLGFGQCPDETSICQDQMQRFVCSNGTSTNLIAFHLRHLSINGTLSESVGQFFNITYIDLAENNIEALPQTFFGLSKLTYLDLHSNNLSGTIPNEFGGLTYLEYLSLSRNQFNGTLPYLFFYIPKLANLILSENSLSGTVPNQVGNFESMITLDLSGSADTSRQRFSGTIPVQIGNVVTLKSLSLAFNDFGGAIPSLGKLTNLNKLDLSNNRLSGIIPSQLGMLISLTYLNLQNNGFSGTIPSQLGMLANLTELIVDQDLKCPNISFQPNEAFQKVCGTNKTDLQIQEDTTLNGTKTFINVTLTQGSTLTGNYLILSTQTLELASNSSLRLINSTITVSGNTTISSLNITIENLYQPAIITNGYLIIQPNSELNVNLPNGLPLTNQTLFTFSFITGEFAKVRVNGNECNFHLKNNLAIITSAQCPTNITNGGKQNTTGTFPFVVVCFNITITLFLLFF